MSIATEMSKLSFNDCNKQAMQQGYEERFCNCTVYIFTDGSSLAINTPNRVIQVIDNSPQAQRVEK